MIKFKNKNIITQILSILIICELAFSPIAICGQFLDNIQKQENQLQRIQSNSCCCEKEGQCPSESESDKSHNDNKCQFTCCYNTPSILTSFDIQTILMQNPYYISEFQVKPLYQHQNIFHPPKQYLL